MLNFTKIKVFSIYIILLIAIFFSSLNLKTNNLIEKKVNLGLDLQGGSYILLEIDTTPLINQKLQSKVIPIKKLLNENKILFQKFKITKKDISFLINEEQKAKLKNIFFFKKKKNQINNFIPEYNNFELDLNFKQNRAIIDFSEFGLVRLNNAALKQSI